MYLSNNYVDINIYPLTTNVMRLWACLYGKGAISNDNIIIIIIYKKRSSVIFYEACIHQGIQKARLSQNISLVYLYL